MNLAATPLSWNACLSALRLDRWMMGELDAADTETVGTHVSSCASCSTALAGMRGVREEVRALPLPAALIRPAPRRRVPGAALAGLFVACQTGSHTRFFEIALLTSLVAGFLLVPHLTSRENRPAPGAAWRPSRTAAILAGAGLLGAAAASAPSASPEAPFRATTWAGVFPSRRGDPFHWAGPLAYRAVRPGERTVSFRVQNARPDGRPVAVAVDLDGRSAATLDVPAGGETRDVSLDVPPGARILRMRTTPDFVPRELAAGDDRRRLAIRVAGDGL